MGDDDEYWEGVLRKPGRLTTLGGVRMRRDWLALRSKRVQSARPWLTMLAGLAGPLCVVGFRV